MLVRDLLERDLDRKIEEIILVDQTDERSVYDEITEYVVTDRIREQYRELLTAIAEAPSDPGAGVGVWISGFFGSGKSSFAKNLGYVLANRTVLGHSAAELFKRQVNDERISALIDSINARIPTEVVMFDVQKDRSQGGQGNMSISPFMYRVLLRELGYAEDFDVAELEIDLESEGRLDEFIHRFNASYAADNERNGWTRRGRAGTQVWNRAGAILHEMDPRVYPSVESFARSLAQNRVDVTPRLLVERTFELGERRRPSKALTFVVDEVGAYVAYSQERLEDLRAVVELFGNESKNRVRARRAIAPVWVIVTAQEKLDEVTSAMGDDRRVLLAKVRDRFKYEIDLSPADIREVATRRVLSKTPDGERRLESLFDGHQGALNAACRLERTTRRTELTGPDFAHFYPYLPHYIELSIDIMSGIRLQPGAMRHVGGSNRTIIGQVYQMLINPRTLFADKPVGALVSLDRVYELVEGQVGSAKQKDVTDVMERFKGDPDDGGWAGRVVKAISLLEFVRDLPRTAANLAAMLVDEVGRPSPLGEVTAALERLEAAQFVRNTEDGYKLQTAQEKNWTTERNNFLPPKPRDRNGIKCSVLAEIFADPRFKTYTYRGLRTFSVGVTVDGTRVIDGSGVPLSLRVADDESELAGKIEEARADSTAQSGQYDVFYAFALTSEIDDLIGNLYASRQMIARYDGLRAQGRITNEEAVSLGNERSEEARHAGRLRERMSEALGHGTGLFRGVAYDASDLGKTTPEVFKRLFDVVVPDLYPKLEMGAKPLKGDEAEDVLKAANLSALPGVFYASDGGLDLVRQQEGQKYVLNRDAEIAQEVLGYLRREHSYGNKVTGKGLEERFGGIGYGWDRDVLRLVLAVLLRAGAIEVTYQGRRFRNHQDPQCRVPLTNTTAFRAAAFAPRESIDLKTLIKAVGAYESLTGDEVDVEEGAIATAFKRLAAGELAQLLPVMAEARANGLPVESTLEDYRATLTGIQDAASDDCVRILAGEGASLKESRDRVRRIHDAVSEENLSTLRRARTTVDEMWPALRERLTGDTDLEAATSELIGLIERDDFYERLPRIAALTSSLRTAYRTLYLDCHQKRFAAFSRAIEEIKGRTEWQQLTQAINETEHEEARLQLAEVRDAVLLPLASRTCAGEIRDDEGAVMVPMPDLLPADATRCVRCRATVGQMESDLAALPALRASVVQCLQQLVAPEERIARVRAADFFGAPLDSSGAIDEAVNRLSVELHKRVAEGVTVVVE